MYWIIKDAFAHPEIFMRYFLVGTTGALTNLGVIYVCTDIFGLYYIISAAIAAFAGYITAFILHKYWTFKDFDHSLFTRQALSFLAVSILNMAGSIVILFVLVEFVGWWYFASQAIAVSTMSAVGFFINRHVTFNKREVLID